MAETYKINYAGNATPLEIVTLADGTTTLQAVNSLIDKSFSSQIEKSYGTNSDVVIYRDHNTVAGNEALNVVLSADYNTLFLYIGIKKALSTGTPTVYVSFSGTSVIKLLGVGDFVTIPVNNIALENIIITSSNAINIAEIEILAGCQ